MYDDDGTPNVEAEVLEYSPWTPGSGARYALSIVCPYCRKKHTHDAGTTFEEIPQYAGHRIAHCGTEAARAMNRKGYRLHVAMPVNIARKIRPAAFE